MSGHVNTVLGEIPPASLGHVAMHEHLIADLTRYAAGGEKAVDQELTLANQYEARVDRNNRRDWSLTELEVAVDELGWFGKAGGGTLVEVSSVGLGRDPQALREISRRAGVNVVMGCGYYVADWHPPEVAAMSRDEITARIVTDVDEGADGGDIRAGVIGEIGMSWPQHPDEVKVLQAAAQAQVETGAALMIHTGRDATAPETHVACAMAAGADVSRTIVCHLDRTLFSLDPMLRLAQTGCILEFDMFGTESAYYPLNPSVNMPNDGTRVRYIAALAEAGHADQIVISSDVCRKTMLSSYGGEGYSHILRRTLDLMRARRVPEDAIDLITRLTPARLLEIIT